MKVPRGTWFRDEGHQVRVGATMRSIPAVVILAPLVIISFAIVAAVFWNPSRVAWRAAIPCVAIALAMGLLLLRMSLGWVEVVIRGGEAERVVGVGPLKRRRRFDPAAVSDVRAITSEMSRTDSDRNVILIDADAEIRFGQSLTKRRRTYLLEILRALLLSEAGELTPALARVDTPPRGVWLKDDGREIRVGAKSRMWRHAAHLAVGVTIMAVLLVATGWMPLIGYVLLPGGLIGLVFCLLTNRVEVVLAGAEGRVHRATGPFRSLDRFDAASVTDVREEDAGKQRQQAPQREIVIETPQDLIRLGGDLPYPQRRYIAAALRRLLLPDGGSTPSYPYPQPSHGQPAPTTR